MPVHEYTCHLLTAFSKKINFNDRTIFSLHLIIFSYSISWSVVVLQSTTPALLQYYSSTTPVLLQYYSVLQSTTPVLCSTKYYSSTTPYYKVLLQYYSVQQSTTPVLQSIAVLLCATKYYSCTTPYYKVLLQYYSVLQSLLQY